MSQPNPIRQSNIPGLAIGDVSNTDTLPAPGPAQGRAVNAGGLPPLVIANDSFAPGAVVTALPGGPVDGQVINFLADAANGIVWRLRYRAASASAYKWEYLGGAELSAFIAGATAGTVSTLYGDLGGPSLAIPLAGDYDITIAAQLTTNAAGLSYATMINPAWAPDDDDGIVTHDTAFTYDGPMMATRRKTGLGAVSTLAMYYRSSAAGVTAYARARTIRARPVRVG